jgi:hypothetical protein
MRGAYVVFGVARKPTPMERLVAFGIRWAPAS